MSRILAEAEIAERRCKAMEEMGFDPTDYWTPQMDRLRAAIENIAPKWATSTNLTEQEKSADVKSLCVKLARDTWPDHVHFQRLLERPGKQEPKLISTLQWSIHEDRGGIKHWVTLLVMAEVERQRRLQFVSSGEGRLHTEGHPASVKPESIIHVRSTTSPSVAKVAASSLPPKDIVPPAMDVDNLPNLRPSTVKASQHYKEVASRGQVLPQSSAGSRECRSPPRETIGLGPKPRARYPPQPSQSFCSPPGDTIIVAPSPRAPSLPELGKSVFPPGDTIIVGSNPQAGRNNGKEKQRGSN